MQEVEANPDPAWLRWPLALPAEAAGMAWMEGAAVEESAVWLTVRPGAVGKSLELAEGASVQPHPVLRGNQAQAAGRVA